jgi:hypothetical protein
MQNKLYFLNEEEKNRILNIHQNAIKRQYLLSEESIPKGTLSNFEFKDFASILSLGSSQSWDNFKKRPIIKPLHDFCAKIPNDRITLPSNEILLIVKTMDRSLSYGRTGNADTGFMRGVTEKVRDSFRNGINEFKNIPNFCYGMKNGDVSESGEPIVVDMFDEIAYPDMFDTYVIKPLTSIYNSSKPISDSQINADPIKTDEKKKGWESFSCVAKFKDTSLKDNSDMWKTREYTNGLVEYFSDSGLFFKRRGEDNYEPKGETNFYTFYCKDGKPYYNATIIKKGESSGDSNTSGNLGTGGGGLQPGQWKSLSPQYDEKILKAIGKEGKTLTDDDIKTLYNKLKSVGKI